MARTDAVDVGIAGEKRRLILQVRDARNDPTKKGLLFDLRTFVGYMVRLGSWEGGLVLERITGRDVKVIDEDLKLQFLNDLGACNPASPARRWAEPIPAELIELVRKMYMGQLAVLRAARHCSGALDLLGGAPNLLWLVSITAAERKTPWEELSLVLGRRRRDVLEWCGGKCSQAAVSAIEKAWTGDYTPAGLQHIRLIAANGAPRDLARERLEHRYPELLEFPFYRALVKKLAGTRLNSSEEARDIPELLKDVRALAAALGVQDIEPRLRSLQHVGALRTLHEELAEQLIRTDRTFSADDRAKFPRPALRGSKDIVPIRTLAELDAEGRVMQHCCAVYARDVRNRLACIYRVLGPERATLEIDLSGSQPRVAQLRGFRNAPVAHETWKAVFAWHRSALAEWKERKARRKSAQKPAKRAR